jgi:hypothetical protein
MGAFTGFLMPDELVAWHFVDARLGMQELAAE